MTNNYYSIDEWNHAENTVREKVAVWSTDPRCAYHEWMGQILAHGGSWDAPDGCTYSIHEEEDDDDQF